MPPQNSGKQEELVAKKPWTVMIYMVADDPAGGEMLDQLANQELDEIVFATLGVADREAINVAVQVDFRTQPDVWRRLVGKGTWVQPESAAADPATLYGFFDWVATYCPAYRYLLMFWGHSRGPFGLFTDRFSSLMAGPFADDDPEVYVAQTLTLRELRVALRNARECLHQNVDIIVFKDCFMSTLETAYELKDAATYLIASPDIVPIKGWPYAGMFAPLTSGREARDAALTIVSALQNHYANKANRFDRDQVEYALLDTSALTNVSEPLGAVAQKLAADSTLRKSLLPAARGDSALVDVGVLCRKLKVGDGKEAAEALEKALRGVILTPAPVGKKGPVLVKSSLTSQVSPVASNGAPTGVSVFLYPSTKAERDKSLVARLASRQAYGGLAITATGWDKVAIDGMPGEVNVRQSGSKPASDYDSNNTLLPRMLAQLQRGIIEEIARSAFGFGKPAGFGPKPAGFGPKPAGFGKPAGFASELRVARALLPDAFEEFTPPVAEPKPVGRRPAAKTKK